MNAPPILSLCMIVKDEERFLPACLRSVEGYVDEVIVVDTGSVDRTIQIAESFGATVYRHPWEHDFSKHRNQSIGYAKGDWIFWLDADEALEPGRGRMIREAIAEKSVDSLLVTMVCYFGNRARESWNNSVKLFRNRAGIHFRGAVHNQVAGYKAPGFCPVKIYHYGYDVDPKTVKKKFERTSTLLKRAIRENPGSFHHHHDLAVSYASVHMHRKAIEEGLCAMRLYRESRESDPNILWTHFVVGSSCFNLGLIEQAREVSEAALRIRTDHLDSYFVLASVCALEGDRSGFEKAYYTYMDLCGRFKKSPELLSGLVVNKGNEKWRLDLEYGSLLLREGDERGALGLFANAMEESPDQAGACRAAIHACRQAGRLDLAAGFVKEAEERGLNPRLAAFERAVLSRLLGNRSDHRSTMDRLLQPSPEDAPELLAALGTEALLIRKPAEAELLLMECIEKGYQTPSVFISLGLACKYQGKSTQARQWNLKALEMDAGDIRAHVNLGHLSYELKDWGEAKSWYGKALEMGGDQPDVLLRLSLISLVEQDLSGCVSCCDRIAQSLRVPMDMEIGSMQDLSQVYRTLGDVFMKMGNRALHQEAERFAEALEGKGG